MQRKKWVALCLGCFGCLAWGIGLSSVASAQNGDWVVIPSADTDDLSWCAPTADSVARALSSQGTRTLTPSQATSLFEARGSTSSTKVSDSDIEAWVSRSRGAIRHLARGDYATALQELKRAQSLSRKAADELNREQDRAQTLLDTCLYMVRALLETGNRARASSQVQECVRLVPRGTPSKAMHPPNVVGLYEAAGEPGAGQTGSLSIKSEPSSCDVRINGTRFGATPFEISGLYPGEYQIQVECDKSQRGRVHPVVVGEGRTETFVDARFDRIVQTTPTLALQYDATADDAQQAADASTVAKTLGSQAAVIASRPTPDTLQLAAVDQSGARRGLVRMAASASDEITQAAAAALVEGECVDLTSGSPNEIDCGRTSGNTDGGDPSPSTSSTKQRPPRGQWIAGVSLLSVGAVVLAGSYGLAIERYDAGSDWVDGFSSDGLSLQQEWADLGNAIAYTAPIGSALSTAAMPLMLPLKDKTPWWAWTAGGVGVGAAIGSIVFAATADATPSNTNRCNQVVDVTIAATCVDRKRSTDRAILFGTTAAPLITIPLVYLLRRDSKRPSASLLPQVAMGRGGGSLGVEGQF